MFSSITKLEAAKRQLVAATQLFFGEGDSVAIHTLTRASHEILDALCEHQGVQRGVIEQGLELIKPEHRQLVRNKIVEAKNFFKHADNDPEGILSWNPDVSECYLWDSANLYSRLSGNDMIIDVVAYQLWFRVHHADLWTGPDQLEILLSGINSELLELTKPEFLRICKSANENGMFSKGT